MKQQKPNYKDWISKKQSDGGIVIPKRKLQLPDVRLNFIVMAKNIKINRNLKIIIDPNLEENKIIFGYGQVQKIKPKIIHVPIPKRKL